MPSEKLDGNTNNSSLAFFEFLRTGLAALPLPAKLPARGFHERDAVLRSTIEHESFWAGAISTACTIVAARPWEVSGDVGFRVKESAQDTLHESEGGEGWVAFISKLVQDFLLQDNGAFLEIERVKDNPTAKITRLWVLDSFSCYRTGRKDYPVLYSGIDGKLHALKPYQVIMLSDMPSSNQWLRGVGFSAASRAYKALIKLVAFDYFIWTKVSGDSALALHFIKGINDIQLRQAVQHAKTNQQIRGIEQVMGALLIAILGDTNVDIKSVNLAEIPTGIDRQFETELAIQAYANAIGYDKQQLFPTSGQAIGVGAQSAVQRDQAKEKGLQALMQQLTHIFNRLIMPKKVTFGFSSRDLADEERIAQITSQRFNAINSIVQSQLITAPQGLQILVDQKELPSEFLTVDQTDTESISSDENADEPDVAQLESTEEETPDNVLVLDDQAETTKASRYVVMTGPSGGKYYIDEAGNKVYGTPPDPKVAADAARSREAAQRAGASAIAAQNRQRAANDKVATSQANASARQTQLTARTRDQQDKKVLQDSIKKAQITTKIEQNKKRNQDTDNKATIRKVQQDAKDQRQQQSLDAKNKRAADTEAKRAARAKLGNARQQLAGAKTADEIKARGWDLDNNSFADDRDGAINYANSIAAKNPGAMHVVVFTSSGYQVATRPLSSITDSEETAAPPKNVTSAKKEIDLDELFTEELSPARKAYRALLGDNQANKEFVERRALLAERRKRKDVA